MSEQKYDHLVEWIMSEDFEKTQYQIGALITQSKFQILDLITINHDGQDFCTWIFKEGQLYLRNFQDQPKVFLQLTSFDHTKYLDFVIRLKNYLLDNAVIP